MLLILLLLVPALTGIIGFGISNKGIKGWALLSSLITLVVSLICICQNTPEGLSFNYTWIPEIGANFALWGTKMRLMLTLLTAIIFPLIFLFQWNKEVEHSSRFYALLLLAQAGLMGVFLSNDLLLFYFFWELALIPVYFLAGQWGGANRIKSSFKFFIYTFLGSLIMLAGLIYMYHESNNSFAYQAVMEAGNKLSPSIQISLFWFFFVAFAIKMPIFPLHSWQADAYEQTTTPVTIVLSALMVKMGLFGVLNWLSPVLPQAMSNWSSLIMILSVIGIIYGSLLAIAQTDIKRIIAYSSLAHIGLMSMGIFANTEMSIMGLSVQMFNHGINIAGMWFIASMIEERFGTRNIKEMGGLAKLAPKMTIAFVIIGFSNIALPLTSGFVGEFMLFLGIFQSSNPYRVGLVIVAGLAIILSAIYVLNMIQKAAYGDVPKGHENIKDASSNELAVLVIVVAFIIVLGVFPNLLIDILR